MNAGTSRAVHACSLEIKIQKMLVLLWYQYFIFTVVSCNTSYCFEAFVLGLEVVGLGEEADDVVGVWLGFVLP